MILGDAGKRGAAWVGAQSAMTWSVDWLHRGWSGRERRHARGARTHLTRWTRWVERVRFPMCRRMQDVLFVGRVSARVSFRVNNWRQVTDIGWACGARRIGALTGLVDGGAYCMRQTTRKK